MEAQRQPSHLLGNELAGVHQIELDRLIVCLSHFAGLKVVNISIFGVVAKIVAVDLIAKLAWQREDLCWKLHVAGKDLIRGKDWVRDGKETHILL